MKKVLTKQERYEKNMKKQGFARPKVTVPAKDVEVIKGIAKFLREHYRMTGK
jgi:hypothetical protein